MVQIAPQNLPQLHFGGGIQRGDALLALRRRQMREARAKVLAACKANKKFFLNTVRPDSVQRMIQEGVMIGSGGAEAAEAGRKYTKRPQPW